MQLKNKIIHYGIYKDIISLFIIAIIILISFFPVVFGNKSLYPMTYIGRSTDYLTNNESIINHLNSESLMYYDAGAADWVEVPMIAAANSNIANGELPIWNTFNSLGMPIIDNNNGSTLAPLSLIVNFNNSEISWNFMYLMRLFVIMVFTYLFLRRLKISAFISIVGSVAFGFSGYVISYFNIFFLHVDAFLPMLMWSTLKYFNKKNFFNWFLTVIAISAMCLGGNPQNLITCCTLALGFYLALLLKRNIDEERRNLKDILVEAMVYIFAYVASIILTIGYWLSFLYLYSNGFSYHGNSGLSYKRIDELLGLIIPIGTFRHSMTNYLPYLGICVVVTVAVQLRVKKNNFYFAEKLFFIIYSVLFLAKIVGFPLINWIGNFPVLNDLAFTKYNSALYFSVAVLLCFALNDLFQYKDKVRFIIEYSILGTISFILLLCKYFNIWGDNKVINFTSVLFIFSFIILSTLLLFIKNKKNIYLYAMPILICVELVGYPIALSTTFIDKGLAFKEPEFVTELKNMREKEYDRIFCVGSILTGNLSATFGISSIGGISPTPEKHYFEFMNKFILNDQLDIQMVTTQSRAYYPPSKKYLDMLGVKYFLIDENGEINAEGLQLVYQNKRVSIYKNNNAFNRAYSVHELIYAEEEDVLRVMKEETFNPMRQAVVSGKYSRDVVVNSTLEKDVITITNYSGNSVTLECNMKTSGLVILSDLYYNGWNAYIDGEKTNILRTNNILRGVIVEEGVHDVVFKYEPLTLRIWAYTVLGFIGVSSMALFIKRRKM